MDISGPAGRRVVAGAVVLLVAVMAAVGLAVLRDEPTPSGSTTPRPPVAVIAPSAGRVGVLPAVSSLAILRDWDRARAAAWRDADVARLRGLYVPGAPAGRADVAMLQRWSERGVRVEGMSMQVLSVVLRVSTSRRVVLVVTDRLVGAEAVRETTRTALPQDQPSTRRLDFRRWAGRWLLAVVQEIPSPVRSTDSTSGSSNS
ncbi:hypothetical protein ACFQ0K_17345 [Nocardioides caeni]|uniref:Uncharacterized protein n=1 Tax=Nocardioides caeni TaxID=574700 RepID=A0A4S8NI92_9ACTN|nr:hypothetical protein [Nocardioides caeni]THV15921.1 hypothetical protein E9934_06180 [Nocardioides caeni]